MTSSQWYAIVGIAGMISAGSAIFVGLPAHAQSCVALKPIGATTTTVEKTVSPPSTGITGSNWNTDFIVPDDTGYSRYVATLYPLNGGTYDLTMNLKYANDTADQVYNQSSNLPEKRAFNFSGAPRLNSDPYQVNIVVGGLDVVGDSYRLSVAGCR